MPEDDLHSVAQATLAGDSTAPEDAPDSKNQPEDLLSLAERLYEGQIWGVPGGSEAAKAEGSPGGQLGRQTLVVQMHIAAKNRDWWKVLQLKEGSAEKEVRASYKKLAQQIHPDKCPCFGAEQAFQHLTEAVVFAMGAADGGLVKLAAGGGDQHAWWDKWDADSTSTKRKREEDVVPQSEEETLHMRQCPLEELKAVVAELQSEVLRPEKGSDASKLTAAQRSQRVRAARAILNERLAYAKNAPQKQGGFF